MPYKVLYRAGGRGTALVRHSGDRG